MNLRQIEVFRAVMLAGSVSGAAQLLHVSQPAVSRLISYTESRLGFALFQRLRGRLHPTPEAHKLFSEVEVLYQGVQRINGLAGDMANQADGVLRVACSPSLAYALMPMAIAAFSRRFPDVRVTLDGMLADALIDSVLTQRADVLVAMVPVQHPRIQVHKLFRNRVVAVLPPDHKLAERKRLRVADLKNERIIGYGAETPLAHAIGRLYDGARIAPRWVAEVMQTHVACAMVQQGLGIALVDELAQMGGAWPGLHVRELTPTIDLQVRLGYARHEPLSAVVQAFVDEVQALRHPLLVAA
ncbi:LysR substrate-binding domain-containing protein [Achromobacter aloeverae]|uniref:LysR family transcriptional regulator n=1 Tax=Achromobacter aloeverae TaxID=1750518 RepID=A0A4V1MS40_9BURK|nr:LysR substrate-binding domain-containing protein [Achromobacter aloeverae]RXN88150.1 LysR family transcriptional regulator [Achromobacter aloeverae]